MATTILIAEDDEEFSYLLGEHLESAGYRFLFARDGVEAVRIFEREQPDLILLDVMMPRMDGLEVCRHIRHASDVPIIIVSCRTTELDKVRGLELGADDYITKPVSHREFVARVQAALRRSNQPMAPRPVVRVDDRLTVDRVRGEVLVDGEAVDLSPTEYKLLSYFLDHPGRILTHQSLLTQVWGWEYAEETGYLKVHIHNLRKKIESDAAAPRYIVTERGLGYRFEMSDLH
jgi:two-component system, OmpR family, KDP operon response regulator KdpE